MRLTCSAVAIAAVLAAAPAAAQNEQALKSYFEGKRVTLRIDMPATSDGVDVHADASRAIDYRAYGDRLKTYGASIRSGESAVVTLVKVKKDLIEFQLGGGGFGTFGDDTSTSVYIPHVEKSSREKELERRVKDEDDSHRRRELERELDDVRDRRERENRRIDAERARASEIKKERIAEQRLQGGSRFNVRYDGAVPSGIRPEDLMAVLDDYVQFAAPSSVTFTPSLPLAGAADASALRKGMLRADVERVLGRPYELSERHEGTLTVATLIYTDGGERITAEFVEDVLVRYSISSR